MDTFLNFHAHRPASSPKETVITNLDSRQADECDRFSVGIHPMNIGRATEADFEKMTVCAAHPHCVAIGETGLDRRTATPMPLQYEAFLRHIHTAAERRLPVIVHCVRAWGELEAAIRQSPASATFVVHGFRGKPQLAERLLRLGVCLSFGFRFNEESLLVCPSDRLFLETDEDPRPIEELYREVARLRGTTAESLQKICHANLLQLTPHS